jgi:hypothetical protein
MAQLNLQGEGQTLKYFFFPTYLINSIQNSHEMNLLDTTMTRIERVIHQTMYWVK